LVDRFLATESFLAAYEERYADLYETLIEDGVVADLIDAYAALLVDSNVDRQYVTDTELESAVAAKQQWVAERATFLESLIDG
jgi:spore coat protein CotH